MKTKWTGTYTALVTPFDRKGRVDEHALGKLIAAQIKGGVDGIVPVGTTGESPTLSMEEHIRVIRRSVEFANGKVKIMAGVGANSTDEAIELTQGAEEVGADGLLHVAPYYNKPSQEGLFQHFHAVARITRLPVILYSVPSRCGIEIGVETMNRLVHDCPNIAGIKEAGGTPDRVSEIRHRMGKGFYILSGDDALTLPFMSVGACGVVSVASNIIPKEVSRMVRAFEIGKPDVALKLHTKYYEVFKNLFIESNPVPIKAALTMTGVMGDECRLPLVKISAGNKKILRKTLESVGILK
ncbi:MAG: 4-hydroxy-tetrahydrodipicolinate synthase [Verrucomicrobiales bacterium]|nr:4-hydroxy-tetrahydrodipicolinate synthase [Verrucomicrobiales bacterium]|tara:strand:+ start:10190 stop:11080 length:891 start_codon:yes stop_codon:yes gene_type:complete